MSKLLEKLSRNLHQRGLYQTSQIALRKIQSCASDVLSGNQLYYSAQKRRYLRNYTNENVLDPVWVDPDEISYLVGNYNRREKGHLDYTPHFKPREIKWSDVDYCKEAPYRSVQSGDWDQPTDKFSELLIYRAIDQHFTDNIPWSETKFYQKKIKQYLSEGVSTSHAQSKVSDECKKIERLYTQMDAVGYMSQRELNNHPLHEITVCVSRDGKLMYNCEGRHRLSVAKILDIQQVPVLVLAIHEEFSSNHESS